MTRPIGIIGAMDPEVRGLIARLADHREEVVAGIKFHTGTIFSRPVVIARCGVGKVFASMCATAMIIRYSPALIVNTGVGGAVSESLRCADTVVATRLLQYDMDTSPLGDPVGLISGINQVYFDTDERASELVLESARELGIPVRCGVVATGDRFVADAATRDMLRESFGADVCEMEGGAIAQACFVSGTPFTVVRAISDGANGNSVLDYPAFLKIAAANSERVTLAIIEKY